MSGDGGSVRVVKSGCEHQCSDGSPTRFPVRHFTIRLQFYLSQHNMRLERWMFRLLFVSLVSLRRCCSLSISHWDLEGANRTCEEKASCSDEDRSRVSDVIDWRDRNCLCDEDCRMYGDCCVDSPRFELGEQRRGLASFPCVELRQFGGIYMRTACPPEWGEPETRKACETASEDLSDPLAGIPATSHTTRVTYRNLFCAICHGELELDVWHPRLECPNLPTRNVTRKDFARLLRFDEKHRSWGLDLKNKFHRCDIDPVLPSTSGHIVRRCPTGVVKTCAVNWTNADVRMRCEAYTSLVYESNIVYRNPHCAMCNNVPLQFLRCSRILFRTTFTKDFSPVAFSVLFDLSSGDVGKKQPCKEDQLFDPFFKRCRSVLVELRREPEPSHSLQPPLLKEGSNFLQFVNITNHTVAIKGCKKFVLDKGDFTLENNTAFVPLYKKLFMENEFSLRDDGRLEVCAATVGVKLVDKFGIYMGYVTYAGLGISIIFLLLHLAAFCLVSELRNLSGKNLSSLCVALLVAYTTFMAGQVLIGVPCFIVAVLTFYSFLASFAWMLTMSFDVWRTLRMATAELRVSAGKQWRKFFIYSLWSWTLPALIVGCAVWVQLDPEIAPEWKPDFAVHSCWFGRSRALLLFFAAPLAIIMGLNIAFFGSSAHMIYSTTSTTRFTASAGTQRDFRLYLRLAVVMGLTWTSGLVAGILDVEFLWYIFIALNTLQGLFIFLAFTCNDKVIRGLAVRHAEDKPLRPPSFSWSSDSTRKSQVGSDQTIDTLY